MAVHRPFCISIKDLNGFNSKGSILQLTVVRYNLTERECFISSSVTPEEWQDFSDKNILKAEREKNSSINLRSIVDGVLMQSFNDLKKQCAVVDLAFENRIEETEKAKTKLEIHLTKVITAISIINHFILLVILPYNVNCFEIYNYRYSHL